MGYNFKRNKEEDMSLVFILSFILDFLVMTYYYLHHDCRAVRSNQHQNKLHDL